MKPCRSRQLILVLAAFAMAMGSLVAPEIASADKSLFRVERTFLSRRRRRLPELH
jgi:hypothetical protein